MATGHIIAMSLRSAYLSMHRQTNSFLAPYGMTADQFVLLALLVEEQGITQQELTERASSDPNTVRAMLVLMEAKEFVKRSTHPNDGRALQVTLTRKGRDLYKQISRDIRPLQKALVKPFKVEQTNKLVGFLNRVSKTMMLWEENRNKT